LDRVGAQRLAQELMQPLGQAGAHARPLAGRQDHTGQPVAAAVAAAASPRAPGSRRPSGGFALVLAPSVARHVPASSAVDQALLPARLFLSTTPPGGNTAEAE